MMRSPSPLPDDIRRKSGEKINDAAIDLLGLASVARKAHWNIRGTLFAPLHDLFGKLYDACSSHADILAEHSAMLGLSVRGDHVDVAQGAEAEPIGNERDGIELCSLLSDRIRSTLSELKSIREEVDELGDEDGCQLLCDASIAISKLGWQIGAYIEDEEPTEETIPASERETKSSE